MTDATLGVEPLGSHEVHWKFIDPNDPLGTRFFAIIHDAFRHVPANRRFACFVTAIFEPFGHMPFKLRLVPVIWRRAPVL